MSSEPEVSVVIPTYNRPAMLREAVESVLDQESSRSFEIVIVDNNSQDDTRAVAQSLVEQHGGSAGKLRYVFESRQGNAHARNTGVEAARGDIVAFIDDDVTVERNWLKSFADVLDTRSELSFVGGPVLPRWDGTPPQWLTPEHWAPLALLDYGPRELPIDDKDLRGLITANIAFRRSVFEAAGGFLPNLQRVKNRIGSLEDHEFILRVCRSGKRGLYLPGMIAMGAVETERLSKAYHRRWHTGHGHFYAVLRDAEWERSKFSLLGVPGHLYRETAANAVKWFTSAVRGDDAGAFASECRLRFFYGFLRQRARRGSSERSGA
jgi:glycosyltransferase involved in cell wall biosynthesis